MIRNLFVCVLVACGTSAVNVQGAEYDVPNMLGDGGLVQPNLFTDTGRVWAMQQHTSKIGENNSVIPRDRVALGFNALNDVRIGNLDTEPVERELQEYRLFAEKTFLDGNASLEFILPLLNTSQTNIVGVNAFGEGPSLGGDIGNLAFGLKALLIEDCAMAMSTGLRVEAPTASDINVSLFPPDADSTYDLDAWYFTPWLGVQWQPGKGWFVSSFASYQLNSAPIDITDRTVIGGIVETQVRLPNYLSIDASIGKWILERRCTRHSLCIAPVLEFHYTSSSHGGEILPSVAYATGRIFGNTDYLNVTAGIVGKVDRNIGFGLGIATPLRRGATDFAGGFDTDRSYEWALMANLNYFFR